MTQPVDPIPQADIYVLQGDDEFSTKDYLKALAAQIRAENSADLDVVSMDGQSTDRTMLAQTLNSLSLFSPARLVILEGALDTLRGKEDAAWLTETLKQLPQNTRLALVISDSRRFSKGEWLWEKVGKGHWLRASLNDSGKKAEWVEKMLPKQAEMAGWIMDEARRQAGGDKERFEGRAAAELANLVGNNLFQVRQEIAKALDYIGPEGTVTREDVRLLCSQSREEDIFEMVDMVGARNAQKALSLLERLLQDLPAQYIFSMLARQVRLLIMAREVLDERGDGQGIWPRARTCMPL
jgi:DNA polymerase III, delta subunit